MGDVFEEAAALIESLSPGPVGPRYYAGLAARLRTEAAAMRRVCKAAKAVADTRHGTEARSLAVVRLRSALAAVEVGDA